MIIGISGKIQSGKDTIANYLVNKYGFIRIGFADKLKEIAKDLFEWNGLKDKNGRTLLQNLGYAMRLINENIWVNYVLNNLDLNKQYIISDVRYENEAEILKENGAKLWRIERKLDRNNEADKHLSEIDLDNYGKFDIIIDNNGTIEELYKKIDEIMR